MAQLDHSKNWSSISNTNRPHPGGPDGKRKYYNDEKDLPSSQIGLRKITLKLIRRETIINGKPPQQHRRHRKNEFQTLVLEYWVNLEHGDWSG